MLVHCFLLRAFWQPGAAWISITAMKFTTLSSATMIRLEYTMRSVSNQPLSILFSGIPSRVRLPLWRHGVPPPFPQASVTCHLPLFFSLE